MAAGLFEGRYVWHPAADDHEPSSVCVDVRAGRHPNADAVLVETRAHRFLVLAPRGRGLRTDPTPARRGVRSRGHADVGACRRHARFGERGLGRRRLPGPTGAGTSPVRLLPLVALVEGCRPRNRRPTASGRSPGGAPPRSPRSGSGCPRWPVTGSRRCPTWRISRAPWSWLSTRSRHAPSSPPWGCASRKPRSVFGDPEERLSRARRVCGPPVPGAV